MQPVAADDLDLLALVRDDDADVAIRPAPGAHHHQIATARVQLVRAIGQRGGGEA